MNTVSRLDTYLSALLVPTISLPPSTSPTAGDSNAHASSSKVTLDNYHPITSSDSSLLEPSRSAASASTSVARRPIRRGRGSHRSRKSTASSIKLPPPSTPFPLRIALALWSILLSFWMSLVGEIRAERVQRRRRRRVRSAQTGHLVSAPSTNAGEKGGLGAAGGGSSDEGSGTEMDGEGEGDEHADGEGEGGVSKSDEDDGWVDPVTRAPAGMDEEIDEPDEEEFALGAGGGVGETGTDGSAGGAKGRHLQLSRTYSPSLSTASSTSALALDGEGGSSGSSKAEPDAITFRLRSAERRHRDSLPSAGSAGQSSDASDGSRAGTPQKPGFSSSAAPSSSTPLVQINPPTPPKLLSAFQPSSILTNPSLPSSLPGGGSGALRPASPTRNRSNRLLANPIQTSLLDPSKPAVSPSTSTSAASTPPVSLTVPRARTPHTTPFHLQKTLILDLDETLIHSTSRPMAGGGAGSGMLGVNLGALLGGRKNRREGHTVEVVIGGRSTTYHVYKRPYVDLFLKKVATWYTLVIYTASMPEYADPVIDWLDAGRSLFAKRLYRDSCFLQSNGSYIKDLALVEKDLSRVCFMDNSPVSYAWNKANALPIEGWTSDPNDEALLQSLPVLDCLRFVNDVRRILGIRGFF